MTKITRTKPTLNETLKKVTNQLKDQRQAKKLMARRERLHKSTIKKKLVFKNPIEYITPKALAQLCITTDDDQDDPYADWYDETNGLSIDEEWFEHFCHACGYDREDPDDDCKPGKCIDCNTEYINFFK